MAHFSRAYFLGAIAAFFIIWIALINLYLLEYSLIIFPVLSFITASGGSGTGATFRPIVDTNRVTSVVVEQTGSGYASGDVLLFNGTTFTKATRKYHEMAKSAARIYKIT